MPASKSALEANKIYLKDASFESPRSPQVFVEEALNPQIDTQLHLGHEALDSKGFYEMVLRVTATAYHEKQVLFVAEVQQAGVFRILQPDESEVQHLLATACPSILLPFAREALCSLVTKGGFPQLLINTVNFERRYREHTARAATTTPAPGNA